MPGSGKAVTYRWPLIVVGALLAAYGWYVFTQYNLLNDLNQRQLASTVLELRRTVENAIVNLQTTFKGEASVSKEIAGRLCEFDRDQPYIELIGDCTAGVNVFSAVTAEANGGIKIKATGALSGNTRPYTFRFLTGVLMQELAFPDSFQIVFLADAQGHVLFTDAPLRRRPLSALRWGERSFRDSAADIASSLSIQNLSDALGKDPNPGWQELSARSSRTTLSLGGNPYQLYLEPVTIGADDSATSVSLVLAGLVPVESLRRQALAIDTYFLAVIVFVLLLGLLGYPFFKLLLLDPGERYRRRDVYFLVLSTGALLTLFTFAVLAVDSYHRWNEVANRGLQEYARDVERRLLREIDDVLAQLREFDRQIATRDSRDCSEWPIDNDWFNRTDSPTLKLPKLDTIYMQQAAWIGPDGRQVWKITADKAGEKVAVERRPYFRAIRDGNLYQRPGSDVPFFFAPDRSITDGKFYTFLSIPSVLPAGFCTDVDSTSASQRGGYVAAATATLLTLDRSPLPEGYGFAILNREGRVLYHHDPRRSLRENFFADSSDGARLRAMLFAGGAHEITTAYRERSHEIYLHPLALDRQTKEGVREPDLTDRTGLYAAVFRDLTAERASIAHVFVSNMSGPLIALVAFMGVALWIMARAERRLEQRGGAWLWPHEGSAAFYRRMALVYAAIIAVAAILYRFLGAWVAVIVPLAAAGVAIVAYVRHLSATHAGTKARRALASRWWHVAELTLLLGCLISVPCAVFVRLTQHDEFGNTIAAGQKWILQQQEDVQLAIQAEVRALGFKRAIADEKAGARRSRYGNWPAPFGVVGTSEPPHSAWLLRMHDWIERQMPVNDDTPANPRYQSSGFSYSPPQRISRAAVIGVIVVVLLVALWIRWSSEHLFHASLDGAPAPLRPEQLDRAWEDAPAHERLVLIWAVTEHIVNPRRRATVAKLVHDGWLDLAPDLQAASPQIASFVEAKARQMGAEIEAWEQAGTGRSWANLRTLFWMALGGVALFLLATQPALQSGLLTIATAVTGLLTTLYRVYEAIAAWAVQRKAS